MKNIAIIILIACISALFLQCKKEIYPTWRGSKKYEYSSKNSTSLNLYLFKPRSKGLHPAILMFHGGGWEYGTPQEFSGYAKFFAKKGFVSCSASYRLIKKHGTTPIDSIKDAYEAYDWIIDNSKTLNIDPEKIIVAGGSAGGLLAFWIAHEAVIQNRTPPSAVILLNSVLDTTKPENISTLFKYRAKDWSPLYNIIEELPPVLVVHSENDELIDYNTVLDFKEKMRTHNNDCEIRIIPDSAHGDYVWYKNHPPLMP